MEWENENIGNVCEFDHSFLNSPEYLEDVKNRNESLKNLADDILSNALGREKLDLLNDVLIACLREHVSLYREYANSIKKNINLKKYFQKYTFKGKDYLIIPSIDEKINKIHIKSFEISKIGDKYSIVWNGFSENMQESVESSMYPDLIPVNFPDESVENKFSTRYLNRWSWEIQNVDPLNYRNGVRWIESLMSAIEEKWWSKLSDCSESLNNSVRSIFWNKKELDNQGVWFEQQKVEIVQNVMKWDFVWAVNSFIKIIKWFLNRRKKWRVIWLWKDINYDWDEKDVEYLESAISTVLDSEKRSALTYLLSRIKDKQVKQSLRDKWVENPSQFDLFLQNCKPGQVMLTNALDLDWWSSSFKIATQIASWWRWCHALIVSDIIKDDNWVITDAKIIQSTLKWWVHETTLKDYISKNYSSSDLLLADVSEDKREKLVDSARIRIGQKYDRVSIVTDSVLWMDFDSWESWDLRWNLLWKNKSYCSELVFDAIKDTWLSLPEPHISPSDLLLTEDISPQYACYCDKF